MMQDWIWRLRPLRRFSPLSPLDSVQTTPQDRHSPCSAVLSRAVSPRIAPTNSWVSFPPTVAVFARDHVSSSVVTFMIYPGVNHARFARESFLEKGRKRCIIRSSVLIDKNLTLASFMKPNIPPFVLPFRDYLFFYFLEDLLGIIGNKIIMYSLSCYHLVDTHFSIFKRGEEVFYLKFLTINEWY